MGMKGLEGKELTGILRTPCSISIQSYIKFVNYFSVFKGKGPLNTAQKSTATQPQARQAHSHSTAYTHTRTRPQARHALTFQWVCSSHKCISQLFCSLLLFLLFTPFFQKKKLADHSHHLAQAEGMTPTERKPTLTL